MNINSILKNKIIEKVISDLVALAPKNAVIIDRYDKEKMIPVEDIKVGDVFVVRPGDTVPVDGIIVEGNSSISETALTGNSVSVNKSIGDHVSASTINRSGYIKCRATRLGDDTTLSQIIRVVRGAAKTRSPIGETVSGVSRIMLPVAVGIAFVTMAFWMMSGAEFGFAIVRAITVLIFAAPIAINFSHSFAVILGIAVARKNGILFKDAAAMENTGKTSIVALEKTGTVTKGDPVVTDIFTVDSISRSGYSLINNSENELLKIASLLERKSDHPLAKAVVSYVGDLNAYIEDIDEDPEEDGITDFEVLPGHGLKGNYRGSVVVGASLKYISQICRIQPEVREKAVMLATQGKTPICIARDNKMIGIIAVADPVKKETAASVKELKNMGIHSVMLTGDNQRTAMAIGDMAGVDEVASEILRDQKEAAIKKLKEFGKVTMAGDGVNDAPVLNMADVGIAIGSSTDVEIDAADVVLMKRSLRDMAGAIRLSRFMNSIIRENILIVIISSILGIIFSSGLLYNALGCVLGPVVAIIVVILKCLAVLANSQRIRIIDIYNDRKDSAVKDTVATEILTTEVMDQIRNSFWSFENLWYY